MHTFVSFLFRPRFAGVVAIALTATFGLVADPQAAFPALLDDFSKPESSSLGQPRVVIDDAAVGGQSRLNLSFVDGALVAEGEIIPARGQPGWASLVLLLTPEGQAADLSAYEGIRLKVRIRQGSLSVSANSAAIDNFDYHAAPVQRAGDGYQEARIPFAKMRRGWSEQIPLDPKTIGSVSLVAFGIQRGAFAYEIDEIGFY